MKINPISNKNYLNNYNEFQSKNTYQQKYQYNNVSKPFNNYFYPANINFKGHFLETNIIKKVVGKNFQGLSLFKNPQSFTIDFAKVGADKLAKEPLDIIKATDNEIYAYWHALALSEAYAKGNGGTSWVKRFNSSNVPKPNAVFNSLNDPDKAHQLFKNNLEILQNPSKCKKLDTPITDNEGNDILSGVIFDTETTGVGSNDKIIQLASVQIKNGKIFPKGIFNQYINPEMPIPEAATKVNGITDDMVKNELPIQSILKDYLKNNLAKKKGVLIAYNAEFDRKILNKEIREYLTTTSKLASTDAKNIQEKPSYIFLDPFKLIQRIHPYVGAKKKLSIQYEWLFCKKMENAHDALADVKGTEALRKYCLYFLSKNRKDKSIPLTVREVLIFQNGGKVENIDIPFDVEDCNKRVNFKKSYPLKAISVINYFKNYKLTDEILLKLENDIGKNNIDKLKKLNIINEEIGEKSGKYRAMPAETQREKTTGKIKDMQYTLKNNFSKVLGFAELEPYKGKSVSEIEEFITESSKNYYNGLIEDLYIKNTNPKDIIDGNDLPDIEIARKVMREMQK